MRDPFKITEPTAISFSGGRTSAYMLWRVLQSNDGLPVEAIVCFANTGKEEEATLKFVKDCGEKWGVKIHWLEFRNDDQKFAVVDYETASRNGEPFEALILKRKFLPNPVSRFCTVELKVRTMHRFLKSIGWTEWISMLGIRADEQRRLAKIGNQDYGKHEEKYAPLGISGITSKDVGDFWKKNDFDLELPNFNGKTFHGNCDLCFLKGYPQTLSLIQEKPERAIWWAKMETLVQSSGMAEGEGGRFRKDRPGYADMMNFAKTQGDMFATSGDTIECFCGD
jgi:3'-phosphoadenosine 5'-phosphosulfate sulfotransferase (PAPS reductase)/FAD synthetase